MSWHIPYSDQTYKPGDDLVPGNSSSETPVIFKILPAAGSDKARIRSIIMASAGLVERDWSPDTQRAVIEAFDQGGDVFARTIESIQGLSVPMKAAWRFGLADRPTDLKPDDPRGRESFPIVVGFQFAKIAGLLTTLSLMLAFEIGKLSNDAESIDPRFFGRPSGLPSTGNLLNPTGTVGSARKRPRRRGTADASGPTAASQPSTSR